LVITHKFQNLILLTILGKDNYFVCIFDKKKENNVINMDFFLFILKFFIVFTY